jgi:hypothetical protein
MPNRINPRFFNARALVVGSQKDRFDFLIVKTNEMSGEIIIDRLGQTIHQLSS